MDKELLTIKEFAEVAGVSPQAVYKQLNNKLKPYLTIVDGKKMLNTTAIELFKKPDIKPTVDSTNIQQLINMLQTELNAKNQQIEALQSALDQAQKLNAMDKQQVLLLEDRKQKQDEDLEAKDREIENLKAELQQLKESQEQKQPENEVVSEVAEPVVDQQPEEPDQVAAAAAEDPGRTEESVKVRWWKRLWMRG